jgi:molybdopterin molybdotransferase
LDEALARVLAGVQAVGEAESVSTFDGLGRILAQPVISTIHVPPADNAAMDGVALRTADWRAAEVAMPV